MQSKPKRKIRQRTWIIIGIAAFVLIGTLFFVVRGAMASQEDSPGYWSPHPIGSGWCEAHGVPGVKDRTIAGCQTPPSH